MRSLLSKVGGVLAVTALLSIGALAQRVSGDLTGTIYDQTGATVPNATITARNEATGVESTTKSTSTGDYRIPNLPPGSYTVSVAAAGFTTAQTKGVNVELNQIATNNVTLSVGQATQTVEVTEAAATIDTTTAQVQHSFEQTQLADLPAASTGAGVINLSLLNAGVATSGGVGLGTGPSVGGQRPRDNNFTIEGVDNNNGSVTGPVVSVPNDAVSEFTVLQNQFAPEFGHSTGGQFNQVVISGGNDFHGKLYEYFENRNLNAADNLSFINKTELHPRYDNNRFGGNFGGPIKRNKVFFFGDYDYNPVGQSGSAGLLFAPTAAGWNTLASMPGINQTNLNILKQYQGTAAAAAPPASTPGGAYPLVGPGNASLGLQTSAAVAIPIGQIPVQSPNFANYENGVASVDVNPSDRDNLRFRFILNRSGFIDTAATLPVFFTTVPSNGYIATFSEFHTFSPSTTNEFRLGFNRYSNDYPAGNFRFPGLDQFPDVEVFELNAQLGPDPNAPQFGNQNLYELTDNITTIHGNHTLKFGTDDWRMIAPQSFTQRSRGDYEWNYLSDYLFDYNPDYIAQRSIGNVTYYGNRWFASVYANDSWKLRPNFTLNLGLRYEFNSVPYSEKLQSLNAVSSVPGLIDFRAPKNNASCCFMPRIGLAYSPGTSGRTSFRAGFGINYDVLFDNFGLLTLPPQLTTTVDVTGLDQGGFLANGGIPPNSPAGGLTPAEARAGTGGFVPDQTRPKSIQWNFGVQHVFANNYTFESRYLGTRGIHLPVQIQLNRQPVVNASNALPVYFSAPSQATLNSLGNTLSQLTAAYNAGGNIVPAYADAGLTGIITGFMPWGNSVYHGWANQLTRRFSNGLSMTASYTWSHNIDDSTADVFSTYLTPRRPQDAQNLRADRSSSALDHRHRATVGLVYDATFFAHSNWFLKNIVGNWVFAPMYSYQTGTLVTVQAGTDANLNGDSAGDRTFVNPNGNADVGSGTTPLTNSAGEVVAYVANNPNARYVAAPKGTLPNGGRNTAHLNPINNLDMTFGKNFNVTERVKLQFAGRFFNILNHPQYVGGYISDVTPIGFTGTTQHNFLIPTTSLFADPSQVFSSNPRNIQISAKLIF